MAFDLGLHCLPESFYSLVLRIDTFFQGGSSVVVPQCYMLLCPFVYGILPSAIWSHE